MLSPIVATPGYPPLLIPSLTLTSLPIRFLCSHTVRSGIARSGVLVIFSPARVVVVSRQRYGHCSVFQRAPREGRVFCVASSVFKEPSPTRLGGYKIIMRLSETNVNPLRKEI